MDVDAGPSAAAQESRVLLRDRVRSQVLDIVRSLRQHVPPESAIELPQPTSSPAAPDAGLRRTSAGTAQIFRLATGEEPWLIHEPAAMARAALVDALGDPAAAPSAHVAGAAVGASRAPQFDVRQAMVWRASVLPPAGGWHVVLSTDAALALGSRGPLDQVLVLRLLRIKYLLVQQLRQMNQNAEVAVRKKARALSCRFFPPANRRLQVAFCAFFPRMP